MSTFVSVSICGIIFGSIAFMVMLYFICEEVFMRRLKKVLKSEFADYQRRFNEEIDLYHSNGRCYKNKEADLSPEEMDLYRLRA